MLHHQFELVGVAAVLGDAGIGAERDLDARRHRLLQRLAGNADAPVDLLPDLGRIGIRVGGDTLQIAVHRGRSEEHTSELQSLMRISYAVFCLTKKNRYAYT